MSGPDLSIRNVLWKGTLHDLAVRQGKVDCLSPSPVSPSPGAEPDPGGTSLDARGWVLLPGLTDCHVHLREPGYEYKETIDSGLQAAARGGFVQVMAMANTNPVNDHGAVTSFILNQARAAHPKGPRLLPVGALTKNLAGKELAPIRELVQAGCVAMSNDGLPVQDNELFRHALEYCSDLQVKVIDHCEDPFLAKGGLLNEGSMSGALGLKGQPTVAESLQVARDILLAAYLGLPIHLAHISCRESVELIHWAKAKGIPVTAETCPHYLLWDEAMLAGYNTLAKVNPPLRTWDDVLAVRQGVREGVIDILVTDHAPHADFEKDAPFAQAPNGISGLETALPLSWSLVTDTILSQDDLIRAWSSEPCRIFGLENNTFAQGDPADFVLFDPDTSWKVTPETLLSKGKNTPCLGSSLQGAVKALCIQGDCIFEDHNLSTSS